MLGEMRVRYLVLPAMKPVVSMWRRSFGFVPLDLHELRALEDRCACTVPMPCFAMPTLPVQFAASFIFNCFLPHLLPACF